MSNPIDGLSDTGVHRLPQRRPDSTAASGAHREQAANDTAHAADLLNLTGRARELKALEHELAREPAFDQARVDAIKQSIAQGTYQVDPQRIADKLLALEYQLP